MGATFFSKEKPDFWLIFKEELSGTTAFFSQRKRHSESAPKLFRAFFFARSSRRLRKKTSESGFFCVVFLLWLAAIYITKAPFYRLIPNVLLLSVHFLSSARIILLN